MQPLYFKTTRPLQFNSILQAYIITNYGCDSLSSNVKTFLSELQQNRSIVAGLCQANVSIAQLRANQDILIKYINQLIILKSKLTFGNANYDVKCDFTWSSTGSGKTTVSNNIEFEYYNSLYNLGTLYYLYSSLLKQGGSKGNDEGTMKEITKNYRLACGIFEGIGKETQKKGSDKELQHDLHPSYMRHCADMATIFAQVHGIKVAELKHSAYDLQANGCYGISSLFKRTLGNVNAPPLDIYFQYASNSYLMHMQHYYLYRTFLKHKENADILFTKTGMNYGDVVALQKRCVDNLELSFQHAEKCKEGSSDETVREDLDRETARLADYNDKNLRGYHHYVNESIQPRVEAKVMITPVLPEELEFNPLDKKNGGDTLLSKPIREMINRYKERMKDYISKMGSGYNSDTSIRGEIKELNLPQYGTGFECASKDAPNGIGINDEGWLGIKKCVDTGGVAAGKRILQNIANKSIELERTLKIILSDLYREEKEDEYYRAKAPSEKWCRKPSNELNLGLVKTAQSFLKTLLDTRKYDTKEQNDYFKNINQFDTTFGPRELGNIKIPGRTAKENEIKSKELTREEAALKAAGTNLNKISAEIKSKIKNIFDLLSSDEVVIPSFLDVGNGKTTETLVFDERRLEYDSLLEQGKSGSERSKKELGIVKGLSAGISEVLKQGKESNDITGSTEIQEYFNSGQSTSQLYLKKIDKFQKGFAYYCGLQAKVGVLFENVNTFIMRRNKERGDLIQVVFKREMTAPIISDYRGFINEIMGNKGGCDISELKK